MKTALFLVLATGLASAGTVQPKPGGVVPFPTARWSALLAKSVDEEGRVRYAAIDRAEVDALYASVAVSPAAGSPHEQEAFYLNAYNVVVWKNVLDRLPKLKSVDDEKASFFFFTKFIVAKKTMNLKDLEGDVIRPQFKDPRVHMALNCASGGCPKLPREAFTAENLDAQLDREVKRFVAETRNVDLDASKKIVHLSHIFDWYKDDFGKEPASVLAWINRYRAKDAQLPTDAKLSYVDYDWRLNDQSLQR